MTNNNNNEVLTEIQLLSAIPNIERANSTFIENSLAIFLPFKRLDKTDVQKKFFANNQILEVENNIFEKVEIRGRLLGQSHKDIMEILLSKDKKYSRKTRSFNITTTAYELTKKLGKNIGNKKWLIQQLKEIAECRINIYFKDENDKLVDFNFNFIESQLILNENEITINFSRAYTYFMTKTELLSYKDYINDIVYLDVFCDNLSKKIGLARKINSDFIKAVVRYMLINNGNNSNIKFSNLINKLNYTKLISEEQLKNCITDIKREEIQKYLNEKFGISLKSDETTLSFNKLANKSHYFINQKQKPLF